ncbi:hypothetical protein SEVIR_8G069500v4 [Setaria viridis]|uniref:Cytochrome P450 n=1 Tax=Setaria viridis TaxID=4556 RepID=A0A4U6TGZ0_SETVI|nr:zealexin A1 synthase-like [Setaria viridis]TKV99828.1 hypothetical protein SEVIR_8G069500v2 [Setaria viridis]
MEDKALLAAVSVFALLVVLSKLKSLLVITKPKHNLPPGPWTLPVIGSLHHLGTSPSIHRAMRRLAQKHGPLMTLRLGEVPALVVSSPEATKEIMKTHDIMFGDRHMNATIATLTFNGNDIAFAPYGERWRHLRKICVLEMLSAARVQSFRHIREEEVARMMQNLAASAGSGAAVNLTKMIARFINDTFVRESVGSRSKYQDEYLDALDAVMRLTSGLNVSDLFPSSRLMQVLSTAPRKALACRNRIQHILEQVIQDTKESMDHGDEVATGSEGFVGVLLRLQKESSMAIPLDDNTIVAVMLDMFSAGSETSSTTLNWCMTELVRNPEAMAKAQAEVREAFKGNSTIGEGDLKELSYLNMVIKEALRLHIPAPLLIPRKCRETCQVMGYDVPKGMVVFVNMWAICRNPKYWDNPEEFKPERFENSNLDYKGTDYEFLPFGAGRRICPGINLGVGNIELALASSLYHFDWKLPDGIEPKDVDVCEAAGLVGSKKISLVLHPVTRIPPANVD